MKKCFLLLTFALLVSCTPSDSAIQTAIAKTEAVWTPTLAVSSTNPTSYPTSTYTTTTNSSSPTFPSNPTSSSSSYAGGDTVSLYYGGVEILCGTTEQNYKDLIDTLVHQDQYGFQEMFSTGRAFIVDSGTNALVLDRNISTARVRILEGLYIIGLTQDAFERQAT